MYTILLAEDDMILRENLKFFLSNEGFNVLTAENGKIAVTLAEKNKPDLLVSDIQMPVMGGFELSEKLKENPLTASIPVIYITGDVEIQRELSDKTYGTKRFLSKPFNLADLLDLIEKNKSDDGIIK